MYKLKLISVWVNFAWKWALFLYKVWTVKHFIVEEIPLYLPEDDGQHLYVNLTKVNQTTKDIQKKLARLFKVQESHVGFAGLKDKFARTTQTLSILIGHQDAQFIADAPKLIEAGADVLVAGSFVFNSEDPIQTIANLKDLA